MPVSAVYRLSLRDPAHPPTAVISGLRELLPGVEIGADGEALVFMAANRDLANTVRSAVKTVCGDPGWSNDFDSWKMPPSRIMASTDPVAAITDRLGESEAHSRAVADHAYERYRASRVDGAAPPPRAIAALRRIVCALPCYSQPTTASDTGALTLTTWRPRSAVNWMRR
jgi:hypothetical protein